MTTIYRRQKSVRTRLQVIGRRSRSDNPIEQCLFARERERFLKSFDVKVAYLARCQPDAVSLASIEEQARQLDLFRPARRPIRYIEVKRLGRQPRRICQFGLRDRVAQRIAKDLIEAQFQPAGHIYGWRGRGNAHLLAEMLAAAKSDKYWVLLSDVRDCFQSINFDAIYDLSILPEPFIRANLDARGRVFVRSACQHVAVHDQSSGAIKCLLCAHNEEPVVWRGLLQGSAASSAFLAMLFNDLPSHLPSNVKTFVSADNIAVVAPTEEACRKAETALDRYMSDHRAGPLSLTIDHCWRAFSGFEHLGYSMQRRGNRWTIQQSAANLYKSVQRIVRLEGEGKIVDLGDKLREAISGFPALTADAIATLIDIAVMEL